MLRRTIRVYGECTAYAEENRMLENFYEAEDLSENSMLLVDPKGIADEPDSKGKLPFVPAYVEILPAGLIEDEI
jgi:hypothetical protein